MIAEQLKKAVLQAAIQGKLTKQLPEDGDARDLLKEIQKEKEQLIKEGKIKRDKSNSTIIQGVDKSYYENVPFAVPESWTWCELGRIGSWGSGATPNKGTSAYFDKGTIPWLLTGDLNDGHITAVPGRITELALNKTSVRLNPVGSVLIAMYGATIGKVGILDIESTTNQACCACLPVKGVFNEYLFYFLMSQREVFQKRGEGGAQPNISKEKIVATLFPLPPFGEQLRIVECLDALLPKTVKLKDDEIKLDVLQKEFPERMKRSVLQCAFHGKLVPQDPNDEPASVLLERIRAEKERLIKAGKIKPNKNELSIIKSDDNCYYAGLPESWELCELGSIGNWRSGATPNKGITAYFDKGTIPWLLTGDLNDGHINNVSGRITELALNKTSVHLNPIGSVLIAMYGATIGKVGILDIESTTNQACCACLPVNGVFNEYLFYFLMSQKEAFQKRGEGGAQPNISKEKIVATLFPLPPIAEQHRIVVAIEAAFKKIDSIATTLGCR